MILLTLLLTSECLTRKNPHRPSRRSSAPPMPRNTEHAAKNVKINFGAKWYHKTLQQVHDDPEGREWIAFMLDKKVFNKKHAKHLRPGMLLLGYTLATLCRPWRHLPSDWVPRLWILQRCLDSPQR